MIDVPDLATQRAIVAASHENLRELLRTLRRDARIFDVLLYILGIIGVGYIFAVAWTLFAWRY